MKLLFKFPYGDVKKFNQYLMGKLFEELDLSISNQKVTQAYERLGDYGSIAA